jgi:hypothetical protein
MGRKKGGKNKPKIETQEPLACTQVGGSNGNFTIRGRGRPKGSQNKSLGAEEQKAFLTEQNTLTPNSSAPIKRGRGRPRKNEIERISNNEADKKISISSGSIKDLKRQIRTLKKLKLACRAGSKERIELHRKIKEMKGQLLVLKQNTMVKQKSILKINIEKIDRPSKPILTEEELQEKYPDDNGCSYFHYCKKINQGKVNNICFNPKYFIDKLERNCGQIKTNKDN